MSARTLAVPLPSPAPSAQFQLDPNIKLRVESVFVTVNNSGGGDIKPTLTVSDQNTQEVAAKRQGEAIPAGDTGSATWALRLDDEGRGIDGVGVEKNNTLVGVEPNVDFIDTASVVWTITDQPLSKRVRISAAAAAAGDYTLVSEQSAGFSGFVFAGIPQDARHLVIEVLWISTSAPQIMFNGDTAGPYHTLYTSLKEELGAVTRLDAASPLSNAIDLRDTFDGGYPAYCVITIPYYRQVIASGFRDRACYVEAWQHTKPPDTTNETYRHGSYVGWWVPTLADSFLKPPITSIRIDAGSGVGGRASLYKIR